MADISSGPVSTLPGSVHSLPEGAMCDDHPDRLAVARVQGETDSFGCEYLDMCQECLEGIREYRNSPEARTGQCDWCGRRATDLRDTRDYEEGLAGRLYRVCGACIKRRNERIEQELQESGYYDDCLDDDCDYEIEREHEAEIAARAPRPPAKPAPRITYRKHKRFVRPA